MQTTKQQLSAEALSNVTEHLYAYYTAGQFVQASALCHKIAETNPEHPAMLHIGGLLESKVGNWARAVALINKANAIALSKHAYIDSGLIYEQQGKFNEAAARFQAALSLDPENPEIL